MKAGKAQIHFLGLFALFTLLNSTSFHNPDSYLEMFHYLLGQLVRTVETVK